MPWTKKKLKSGRYRVFSTSGTRAKSTTLKKAKAQIKLLQAVEHGFVPTGKKRRKHRVM